jgi:hypothetical protein
MSDSEAVVPDPVEPPVDEATLPAEVVTDAAVMLAAAQSPADADSEVESIEQPAKVMRIATMVRALLEEVRAAGLDEASRSRLAEIYEQSIDELGETLSPALRDELERFAPSFAEGSVPTDAELRIAKAQLVGWLEGLFHGIQATVFAQQFALRQQAELEGRSLGAGADGSTRPGTYL